MPYQQDQHRKDPWMTSLKKKEQLNGSASVNPSSSYDDDFLPIPNTSSILGIEPMLEEEKRIPKAESIKNTTHKIPNIMNEYSISNTVDIAH